MEMHPLIYPASSPACSRLCLTSVLREVYYPLPTPLLFPSLRLRPSLDRWNQRGGISWESRMNRDFRLGWEEDLASASFFRGRRVDGERWVYYSRTIRASSKEDLGNWLRTMMDSWIFFLFFSVHVDRHQAWNRRTFDNCNFWKRVFDVLDEKIVKLNLNGRNRPLQRGFE